MVTVVNVVGSGSLGIELDLEQVTRDLGSIANYDPNKYPAMYVRFDEEAPLVTVYRTGKYITTGADSEDEAYSTRKQLLNLLSDMEILEEAEDEWFRIQNLVCTDDLGGTLNLGALAIGLGLEHTEYEPEQFPGLIYRPPGVSYVILIFATGRIIVTGVRDLKTSKDAVNNLKTTMKELIGLE